MRDPEYGPIDPESPTAKAIEAIEGWTHRSHPLRFRIGTGTTPPQPVSDQEASDLAALREEWALRPGEEH